MREEITADVWLVPGAHWHDFTNGHRGMARAAKGAKKFINSRRRFHERMALRKLGSADEEPGA
jgi:hypothetical protein